MDLSITSKPALSIIIITKFLPISCKSLLKQLNPEVSIVGASALLATTMLIIVYALLTYGGIDSYTQMFVTFPIIK